IEDVEAIDDTSGGLVPKSFEAWADQDIPAVAIVHEAQFGRAFQGVAGDALRDRLELAGGSCRPWPVVPRRPGRRSPHGDRHWAWLVKLPRSLIGDPGSWSAGGYRVQVAAAPGGGRQPGLWPCMQAQSIDPESG